jgi:hypothetical protein
MVLATSCDAVHIWKFYGKVSGRAGMNPCLSVGPDLYLSRSQRRHAAGRAFEGNCMEADELALARTRNTGGHITQ